MTVVDLLRIVSMLVWLFVGCYNAGAFARVFRNNARYYDEFAALISAIGFLFFAFSLRWYLPESLTLFAGLYLFSAGLGVLVLRALRRYEGAAQ